jgi:signal transduction histidine kinase/CheY-like chemotaxis protein
MAKTTADSTQRKRAKVLALAATGPRRRSDAVALDGASPAAARLRQRYTRLYRRYIDTVREVLATSDKRLVTLHLGWWALERTQAALALVRGRRMIICNSRFHELDREEKGGWRRVDPTSEMTVRYATLHALVAREAATLETGTATVVRRYKRGHRDEYVEVSYHRGAGEKSKRQGRASARYSVADVAVLIQDATSRVRAEHELDRLRESLVQQERLRAIGELASGVAHDLNNTLHAMSLRLSLVEQSAACQAEQGDNIRALSRIITDAALVVGRLQDFARQRHDRPIEPVDLAAVVGEAIDIVRTGIEGQSSLDGAPIRIQTDLPSLPAVPGLPSDLRHVVVNLLLNARDAMPRGGTIRITAEKQGPRVVLNVSDEGSGIPEDDLTKIFDPFFTTKGKRGTGLGLSMARGVLSRLGGDITAENCAGGGACFTLSFPIVTQSNPPPAPRVTSLPPLGRRILIVDDDADNLEATRMAMEMEGQDVDIARNGREAIDRLRTGRRYDLILCDLGMPDVNGWRVAREIQDLAPGTTVYMLTGWAQHIAEDDPRRRWVKGVLEKPMTLERLRELLANEFGPERLQASGLRLQASFPPQGGPASSSEDPKA